MTINAHSTGRIAVALMCAGLIAAGCTSSDPRDAVDAYVGDFSDESYAGGRGVVLGAGDDGRSVTLDQYQGRFLWVDYAAPWCPPCAPQAKAMAELERRLGERVVFLTVVTSGEQVMTEPTVETARMWAVRHGLPLQRVVAGAFHSGMIVPQHMLFSPTGQTLYRHKGLLYSAEISRTLVDHMRTWEKGNLTGGLGWE